MLRNLSLVNRKFILRISSFFFQALNIFNFQYSKTMKYEGALISPSSNLLPDVVGRKYSIVGKRGLFMCRIASLFLLQVLKGDARHFNNIEPRAVISFRSGHYGLEPNTNLSIYRIRFHCHQVNVKHPLILLNNST